MAVVCGNKKQQQQQKQKQLGPSNQVIFKSNQ